MALESVSPHVVTVQPSSPSAGATLTYTVGLTGSAQAGDQFSISASPSNAFTSLPTSVTASGGETSLTFTGTLTSTFSGSVTVTVSNAFGSAEAAATIQLA
jgi:hypothetical protein